MLPDMSTRAGRIDAARRLKGMSMTELGKRLGISQQAVSSLIAGKFPGNKLLDKLAEVLEVEVEWLTSGQPQKSWEEYLLNRDADRIDPKRRTLPHESGDGTDQLARTIREQSQLIATLVARVAESDSRIRLLEDERSQAQAARSRLEAEHARLSRELSDLRAGKRAGSGRQRRQ